MPDYKGKKKNIRILKTKLQKNPETKTVGFRNSSKIIKTAPQLSTRSKDSQMNSSKKTRIFLYFVMEINFYRVLLKIK